MGNKYHRPERSGRSIWILVVAAFALVTAPVQGGQPDSDTLPAPRPVSPPPAVVPPPPVYILYAPPLSRDVWRGYDVDYKGFWRPRVAFTPEGDFYLRSGAPYYWAELYPHWFKARVRGD